ncbi:hypothetical protein [Latilactobacillus fuchuensis]|uniref:Uncharacterized protein n=2 Tax=Latilactobacillus fuchuensis TaxID=164393 RepID=A0A2N9DW82_9LACO|nr:hypothetical protein [Latilactobacillus fuchuensis]KRL60857.1 hypothetical protein FC69_GL001145 [Latilactobacillus fuchuensis DSM 14340 = JCM 11249]MCP8858405.1 hypothetical protein [Latilactobacillus fuchuensis]SPC38795.1 conserved hypothetical protein [Latilactobacillus fuchuensis]
MSSMAHSALTLLLFVSSVAVLISTVMTFIGFLKKNQTLKKAATVVFWISIVLLLIAYQLLK